MSLGKIVNSRYGAFAALGLFCALTASLGIDFVYRATGKLLQADAEMETSEWANYLVSNVPDLVQIANGDTPSTEAVIFFEQARQVGRVFEFSVYDQSGRLILKSNDLGRTLTFNTNIFDINSELRPARMNREPLIVVKTGKPPATPLFYAEALIPILGPDGFAGWIDVHLDQSKRRDLFLSSMTSIAFTIGLILALGPAIGFLYRTRQKENAEAKLRYLSRYDAATGLLNRDTWLERLAELVPARADGAPPDVVIQIDAHGIRLADEALGPAAMDHAVAEMTRRLKDMLPKTATIARVSSEQFSAFLPAIANAVEAAGIAKATVDTLSRAIEWQGHVLPSPVSVGLVLIPHDGKDASRLSTAVSVALDTAIAAGRNCYRFFDAETEKHTQKQRELEQIVAEAFERGYFELYYQPVLELRTRKLTGFEALLRLKHPERGMIPPVEFIPIAEKIGEIHKIGAWCLEEACRTAAFWPPDLTVAVNLSPVQFNSGKLITMLRRALDANRFPAYRLEFEVTEGLLLGDDDYVREQLAILRDMGVRIVLDDFGTGYSSLSYLWQFPFAKIKIDQSFIRAIESSPSVPGILRTIMALGHHLNVPMTAEGVETIEQARFLEKLGCDLVQGYLFSPPVSTTEVAGIILKDFTVTLAKKAPRRRIAKDREAAEVGMIG